MLAHETDRSILTGLLALQLGFIGPEALAAAMGEWVAHNMEGRPIEAILRARGQLNAEEAELVGRLAVEYLRRHGGDSARSLAAVGSIGRAWLAPEQIADAGLRARLRQLGIGDDPSESSGGAAAPPRTAPELSTRMPHEPGGPSARLPGAPGGDDRAGAQGPGSGDDSTRLPNGPGAYVPTAAVHGHGGRRFRVLRPHARGGLGEVYVARDEELAREVALKEIQDRHADDPDSRGRFVLEAEITGGLEHPGIVPVYGLGHYPDGRPYYAMRFIRGDSLKEAIAHFHGPDGPRDPAARAPELRQLLGRFEDVCNALAYAHSRGVLHRDLKPGNIMLGPYGETLVVDWGLAKTLGRQGDGAGPHGQGALIPASGGGTAETRMGTTVGTPQYMSPEQAAGEIDRLGPASDVYSLGATLYSLLTGRAPITDRDYETVLRKVRAGDFPPPRQARRGVPRALEAICLKAMALRPEDRYATPRALAEDIEHWLADEPVGAYREPLVTRLARWGRRHRPLVAGLAALLVTAVVALAVGIAFVSREQRRTLAQRDRAEHFLSQARGAVERYFTAVSESELLNAPGLQGFRRRLLEIARPEYEDFVRQNGDDPTMLADLARAHAHIAKVAELGGAGAERDAEASYRRAIELDRSLLKAHPGDLRGRRELAAALHELGVLRARTARPAEAEAAHREGVALLEAIAAERPDDPHAQDGLATALGDYGDFLRTVGRRDETLELLGRAREVRERIVAADPKGADPALFDVRRELASTYVNLAVVGTETRRGPEWLDLFARARAIQERLLAARPDDLQLQADLAHTLHDTGGLQYALGRLDDALRSFEASRDRRARLVALNTVTSYQRELAKDDNDLGGVLALLGRRDSAGRALERALETRRDLARYHPDVPLFRRDLAESCLDLGRFRKEGGRPADALALYEEARGLLEEVVRADRDPRYRRLLGGAYRKIGILHREAGRPDDARDAYARAEEVLEPLHREDPADDSTRAELFDVYNNLVVLHRAGGRLAEAIAPTRKALALQEEAVTRRPGDPAALLMLGQVWLALGQAQAGVGDREAAAGSFESAARRLREALAAAPADRAGPHRQALAGALLALARVLSLPDPGRGDPPLDPAAADRAVAALREAMGLGAATARDLAADPAFRRLRDRPAFRRLLEGEIRPPAGPDPGAPKDRPPSASPDGGHTP